MASITKKLQLFYYAGATLDLSTAPFKQYLNKIWRHNDAGTAWQSHNPALATNLNAVKQLVDGVFYFVDAHTVPFDIPGAVLGLGGNQPPTAPSGGSMQLTTPGTTVSSGSDVALQAAVSQLSGVAYVKFKQDGVIIDTDNAPAYTTVVSGLAAGSYTFTAEAYDSSDNKLATSNPVTVTVSAATYAPAKLHWIGDSRTDKNQTVSSPATGSLNLGQAWPERMMAGLPSTFEYGLNAAVAGTPTSHARDYQVDLVKAQYDNTKINIVYVFTGVNNGLGNPAALQAAKDDLTAICAALPQAGVDVRIVLVTETANRGANEPYQVAGTDSGASSSDGWRGMLNYVLWMRANYQTLGAYAVMDQQANRLLGGYNAPLNSDYFYDKLHLNSPGRNVQAALAVELALQVAQDNGGIITLDNDPARDARQPHVDWVGIYALATIAVYPLNGSVYVENNGWANNSSAGGLLHSGAAGSNLVIPFVGDGFQLTGIINPDWNSNFGITIRDAVTDAVVVPEYSFVPTDFNGAIDQIFHTKNVGSWGFYKVTIRSFDGSLVALQGFRATDSTLAIPSS